MDLLPTGVLFDSATLSQGTYDAISGDWFVGSLAAGSSASLTITAVVDSGTGGSTITNTVSVEFLSQLDPNTSNNSASVDIVPSGSPLVALVKSVSTLSDPINGSTSPLAIPGAVVRYQIGVSNAGTGATDTDTLVITDAIPTHLSLRVTDFDGSTAGPVAFVDGSPVSGLSYNFVGLADLSDDVAFSEDDGADNFLYVPVPDVNGIDPNVTHIRITPTGSLLGTSPAGDPSAQTFFLMVVQ